MLNSAILSPTLFIHNATLGLPTSSLSSGLSAAPELNTPAHRSSHLNKPARRDLAETMLILFPAFREKGWTAIEAGTYATAWQRFGGSVMTHPAFVERLSGLAGIEVKYLAWFQGEEIVGAIATWGRFLALSRKALKRYGKKNAFDLGNAEVILPINPEQNVPVRFLMRYVSEMNSANVSTLKLQKESIALARSPEEFSKKSLYNQRRELRIFSEHGGTVHDVQSCAPEELAETYATLFAKRWGFEAAAKQTLPQVFSLLRPFMTGSILRMRDKPVAVQILYRVDSPRWISVEYLNGGVDPEFSEYSPGSILTFLNTHAAWEQAHSEGKALRYSFGRVDRDYKMRWCRATPVYRT